MKTHNSRQTNRMGPLNDENKLQVNEKNNKNKKYEKSLKIYNSITFNIQYISYSI